ncbi:MAG TPA: HAMP domain-containing sensor histidine kinase [Gaiellaceae bacterium]|jgi:two-component system sensor histidine kinase MprB
MSLRARLALVAAVAVAVAIAAAAAVTYFIVRNELRGEVDDSLRTRAAEIRVGLQQDPVSGNLSLDTGGRAHEFGGPTVYTQFVASSGQRIRPYGEAVPLPVTSQVLEVARSQSRTFFMDASVHGQHLRVLVEPVVVTPPVANLSHGALMVTRPLTEVDHALSRIRLLLLLVTLGGVAIAVTLGLAVARTALAPVRRLTQASEHVSQTHDLTQRIDTGDRRDELGRLAASFNTMLEALEESARAQQQLVADASHELRTPLTSLRTNIEVLARADGMDPVERERLLADVVEQLAEMSTLVAELVELARGEQPAGEAEDVRLDLLVNDAVARAQRNAPAVRFTTDLEETTVHGVRPTLERAVGNLLDNAAKWSPSDGEVEVRVRDGEVTVRDRGPGIAAEDLPFVFDRFYRASSARGMPGSGLGLAIVRQVAQSHGGSVTAEQAEGGGTRMRLRLAPAPVPAPTAG